jgi:outer membrane protein
VKNNVSAILNVVLLIAVGILFYFHFTSKQELAAVKSDLKKTDSTPQLTFKIPQNLAGAKVLYVNIDTIGAKYEAYADLSVETNSSASYLQKQYDKKAADLQSRYNTYQQNVAKQLLSDNQRETEEAAINAGTEELKKMQDQMTTLENAAMEKNAKITNDITTFFNIYYKAKNIDFILGYGGGAGVLYANDSLNITNDVLKSLNENYRLVKSASKKK